MPPCRTRSTTSAPNDTSTPATSETRNAHVRHWFLLSLTAKVSGPPTLSDGGRLVGSCTSP